MASDEINAENFVAGIQRMEASSEGYRERIKNQIAVIDRLLANRVRGAYATASTIVRYKLPDNLPLNVKPSDPETYLEVDPDVEPIVDQPFNPDYPFTTITITLRAVR